MYSKNLLLFADYLNDLVNIDLKKTSDILFVKNINVYTIKSINALEKFEGVIISPQKISNKLKAELKCIYLDWSSLFYNIISDKVVILKS